MESRLVLSPVAIVPLRGVEPDSDQDVAGTTNDNSESSELSTSRSDVTSQTSRRTSTIQDDTVLSRLSADSVEPASQSAEGRGTRNPIVDSKVSTAATDDASNASPTTSIDQNNSDNERSTDQATSTVAVADSELTVVTTSPVSAPSANGDNTVKATDTDVVANDDVRRPTITSGQPTEDHAHRAEDPVLVLPPQETSNQVITEAANADDIADDIAAETTNTSTGTTSVAVTETRSQNIREPAAAASEKPTSTTTSETSTEEPVDRSATQITVNEDNTTRRTQTVRPALQVERSDVGSESPETASRERAEAVAGVRTEEVIVPVIKISERDPEPPDGALKTAGDTVSDSTGDERDQVSIRPAVDTKAEPKIQEPRVEVVDPQRAPAADVGADTTAPDINEPAPTVADTGVDDRTTISVARITDAVEPTDVTIGPSDARTQAIDDSDSAANKNLEAVDSATTSDSETQPDSVDLPQTVAPSATINSSITAAAPTRQNFNLHNVDQWLSDPAPVPDIDPAVSFHAVITPGSESNSPWRCFLFLSDTTAQTDTALENSDASHTFFGDATRVGLMLAAINHAGRRSGSVISMTESFEELRTEGSPYSRERRRRRSPNARRIPTSFDRLRQAINPLETVDEHDALPSALPSPDVVFADAASMSLLYQNNFGGSLSPRYGFLWGSLLLGGAGLAVHRAGRSRKSRARRQLILPAAPRNSGETRKFSD